MIRKVDKVSGVISTVAGIRGLASHSGDGGLATEATLYYPACIAFSPDGQSMYIADRVNHRVRMVRDGIITTVAGNGASGFGSDGVLATNTSLYAPYGVTILPTTGELVIADTYNHRIRKVDSNGIISTVAGTGKQTGEAGAPLGDNGPATSATLNTPYSIIANSDGEIIIADLVNYRIRKIDTSGVITTIAGTGTVGATGDNGPATSAQVGEIRGLAINSVGDLYLADQTNHCIRKVFGYSQIIINVAGFCGTNSGGYWMDDVPATTTNLKTPTGVAVSSDGEIVIADRGNHRVRKVTIDAKMNTMMGNGVAGFSGESGIAIDAKLNFPTSVTVTNNGDIIINDFGNRKIRKVDRNGIVYAIAGEGVDGFGGDGGSALNALLRNAGNVVATDDGDLLFADTLNDRIRKVDSSGTIVTIAGNGNRGFSGDGVHATTTAFKQYKSTTALYC